MKKFIILLLFLFSSSIFCQQLVYTPVNPNFGGNTFNYQWLLSSANAQNSFEDASSGRQERSELEDFQRSLNRQLLGQLTRDVFNAEFGEGLQEGVFNVGSLLLEIFETGEGLVINILDTNTGEQTQIIVPN
ncbi:curli production assembly/transport component CsgF [Zeaxanthinibacter enoshimensis]|uniref:Curli production assembly/transport component CsgF n=1 Tax=Zeaxanthinibacter enoshimensis TaxID=392009 RepID=A0A4R6TG22_9FLAO|nr:curli production assembly/transport component CsgF [Zeaxanthinibacter enoshimensis]TDQ29157.1 curli production assembly/transport component CsgF [Zeaxanthinibacter enoshimensis]